MIGIVMLRIRRILIFIARLSQVLRRYLSGLHVWVFHMSDKNRCTWCFGSLTAIYLNVLSHWCWCILCGLLTGMATAQSFLTLSNTLTLTPRHTQAHTPTHVLAHTHRESSIKSQMHTVLFLPYN